MKNKTRDISIEQLENYIMEWYDGYLTKYIEIASHPEKTSYEILDQKSGEIIYSKILNTSDLKKGRDLIVSTDGFINEEFKGIIEKCIELDEMIKEMKESSSNQSNLQKAQN